MSDEDNISLWSSSDEQDGNEQAEGEQGELIADMDAAGIAKLLGSQRLQQHLERVTAAMNQPRTHAQTRGGSLEDDPEYKLIVESNVLVVEIDNDIHSVHKFVRDHYASKFPELEQLVPTPMDYMRVVRMIGNEMDLTELPLDKLLPSATVMVVVVSATTTTGQPLPPDELKAVMDACDLAVKLDDARTKLLQYIESRMNFIAPNLSAVVGMTVAAKLIGAAGGLAILARTPAGNIQVMGAKRKHLAGFSTRTAQVHAGYLHTCDLITNTPPALRVRAVRLLAGKCALMARIDWARESEDGHLGREMRQAIEAKIEKWQEPPQGKKLKALPAPIEKAKKKRGGRKARKLKEKMGMTDVRKQMNRVAFGGVEETYRETGIGFGMLGQSGSGKVRITPKDSKSVAKAHKLLSKDAAGTKTSRTVSGLTTSLAFTPVQGLELEDPVAAQERARALAAKEKYFGNMSFSAPKRLKPADPAGPSST